MYARGIMLKINSDKYMFVRALSVDTVQYNTLQYRRASVLASPHISAWTNRYHMISQHAYVKFFFIFFGDGVKIKLIVVPAGLSDM